MKYWSLIDSRCPDIVEEFVEGGHSTPAPTEATPSTAKSFDPKGHTAFNREPGETIGDVEVKAKETSRLGQHDEGGRKW